MHDSNDYQSKTPTHDPEKLFFLFCQPPHERMNARHSSLALSLSLALSKTARFLTQNRAYAHMHTHTLVASSRISDEGRRRRRPSFFFFSLQRPGKRKVGNGRRRRGKYYRARFSLLAPCLGGGHALHGADVLAAVHLPSSLLRCSAFAFTLAALRDINI